MRQFRVIRNDSKNLAIEVLTTPRKEGKAPLWKTYSYHGNSLRSLAKGLQSLMIAGLIPEGETLEAQIQSLLEQSEAHFSKLESILEHAEVA